MKGIALKRLCSLITRGSAPTYSETDAGTAWAIGQSCQTSAGGFDPTRGRWHVGPVPVKGRLAAGDILINSTGTGTLGRVALVDRLPADTACFADGHVTVLRVLDEAADARFVAYLLGLPASRAYTEAGLSVGATKQTELSVEGLRSHSVVVPDRASQVEIADFLDLECARLAGLTAELAALSTTLDAQQREHISRQLDGLPLIPLRYRLAGIEQGWSPQCDERLADPGEWGVLKVGCVNYGQFRPLEHKRLPDHLEPRQATEIGAGDVLMSRANTRELVGSAALVSDTAGRRLMLCDKLYRLLPTRRMNSEFLVSALCSREVRDQIEVATTGASGSMQNISQQIIRALSVPDCDPPDQASHVEQFHRKGVAYRAAIDEIEGLQDELAEYRDSLITESVTGQLQVSRLSDAQMEESLDAVRHRQRPEVLAT